MFLSFDSFSIPVNVAIFVAAAVIVWFAGARLASSADIISERFGFGQAMVGVLLLGGVTSLPEVAVAGSASIAGNAPLAVNNMLGGFSMQVAVLAVADAFVPRRALTASAPDPMILLQGVFCVLLAGLVALAVAAGDIPFLGAGAWTWALAVVFLYAIRKVSRPDGSLSWRIDESEPEPDAAENRDESNLSTVALTAQTVVAAAAILAAGVALSQSGEALAEQTGLGSSFFGAVFVAISTSLPEISTVLAAVRLKRYVMAVSDIFGTNLFDIVLIFVVDLLYVGPPVLNEVGAFSIAAALIGVLITSIYLAGLIERRDPAILGVGLDSIVVLAVYGGGLWILYGLR